MLIVSAFNVFLNRLNQTISEGYFILGSGSFIVMALVAWLIFKTAYEMHHRLS